MSRVEAQSPPRLARLLAGGLALLLAAAPLWADYSLAEGSGLPDGLPDWLPPLLQPEGFRLTGGEGVDAGSEGMDAEFWFRTELPEQAAAGEPGVEFGNLSPGVLVGLARFNAPWSDYKKQQVPPGLYTLRYGRQPADGDHTGQTYFRDFLMMVPLAKDVFVADGVTDVEPVVVASEATAPSEHPAVIALYRIYACASRPWS